MHCSLAFKNSLIVKEVNLHKSGLTVGQYYICKRYSYVLNSYNKVRIFNKLASTNTGTSEYLILAILMSSWSAGEHMLRPMGSIFFNAATIREVCTE